MAGHRRKRGPGHVAETTWQRRARNRETERDQKLQEVREPAERVAVFADWFRGLVRKASRHNSGLVIPYVREFERSVDELGRRLTDDLDADRRRSR
jgi:hypothetical protein